MKKMNEQLVVNDEFIKNVELGEISLDELVYEIMDVIDTTEDLDDMGKWTTVGIGKICKEWYENRKEIIGKWKNTRLSTTVYGLDTIALDKMISSFCDNLVYGENFTMNRETVKNTIIKVQYGENRNDLVNDAIYDIKCLLQADWSRNNVLNNKIQDVNEYSHTWEKMKDYRVTKGEKISKAIIKILKYAVKNNEQLNDDDKKIAYNEVEVISQNYSKLVEQFKQCNTEKTIYLSVDIRDFFRCSYGKNWYSCHRLGGEYGSGAISYTLNPRVAIAYASENGKELDWRQIVYMDVNQNIFIGSRQYKNDNKTYSDGVVKILKTIYGDIFDEYNGYNEDECLDSQEYARKLTYRGSKFGYNDIHLYGGINRHIWNLVPKGFNIYEDEFEKIEINHTHIYCIDCGEKIYSGEYDNDYVHCSNCREGGYYCEYCGCFHNEEYMVYVDSINEYVCESCLENYFEMCEHCGEWYLKDNMTYVDCESFYVCEDCLYDNYIFCDYCGEWHPREDMIYVESTEESVCESCLDYYFAWCEGCNDYHRKEDLKYCENYKASEDNSEDDEE